MHKKWNSIYITNGLELSSLKNTNRISFFILFCLLLNITGFSQVRDNELPDSVNHQTSPFPTPKKLILGGLQVALWGGSFYSLNRAWYANYPRTKFHTFNDWREWKQMDKAGHIWTTYSISEHTDKLWRWAGTSDKKAAIIGSLSSICYSSVVEVLDGFSDKWGFSPTDVVANLSGTGIYLSQSLLWNEQRVRIKLSYHPVSYGNLNNRANQLFGTGDIEKMLKDYNGQTYWASINIHSFFPKTNFPKWLNLALGYGAESMLGGYDNAWYEKSGNYIDRKDIARYRKFYISADIDLTKIKTRNKVLKTVFSMMNVLKIPAPALEFNSTGKLRFHPLYY